MSVSKAELSPIIILKPQRLTVALPKPTAAETSVSGFGLYPFLLPHHYQVFQYLLYHFHFYLKNKVVLLKNTGLTLK